MLLTRQTGILMPFSSLPGSAHCGDLGSSARHFIDHLSAHNISVWQFLPLHPTENDFDNSPYAAQSIFAGDERYISVEDLVSIGWLSDSSVGQELGSSSAKPSGRADYASALIQRQAAIDSVFKNMSDSIRHAFTAWRATTPWVDSYSCWRAIADEQKTIKWTTWPEEKRKAGSDAVKAFKEENKAQIDRIAFGQYVFAFQWNALHEYSSRKGVHLFGDIPIYPNLNSADVWISPSNFKLDENEQPLMVSGVPPDYFSADGQLWGMPVYNWEFMKSTGFNWWSERLRYACRLFDIVRLDHFIGLVRAYEIPAHHTTAKEGSYVKIPTRELFTALAQAVPGLPIVAEDLGVELESVDLFIQQWRLPGMKVLQLGFGSSGSVRNLPHNASEHTVMYTGTHDNDTCLGWYRSADEESKKQLHEYIGVSSLKEEHVAPAMVRLVLAAPSRMAVIPVQDVLGLGAETRVNTPGTSTNNWGWRVSEDVLYESAPWQRLNHLCKIYGRAPVDAQHPAKGSL